MANEIVKFKADSGQEVTITPSDVKRLVCPQATDKEVALFMAHCASHRLDPIGAKDAYLVKYGDKPASIITGYQVFNRRARKCKDYAGIKSGVVTLMPDGTVQHKAGSAVYPAVDGILIGAWAEVHVKGWEAPAYVEVSLSDYANYGKNGRKTNWDRMPSVMLEKVAKASAWRLAYPDEFSGMYTREEMDQAAPDEPVEVQAQVETDYLQPVRDLIRPYASCLGYTMAQAVGSVCDEMGVERMQDLDEEGARQACEYMRDAMETPVMEVE